MKRKDYNKIKKSGGILNLLYDIYLRNYAEKPIKNKLIDVLIITITVYLLV